MRCLQSFHLCELQTRSARISYVHGAFGITDCQFDRRADLGRVSDRWQIRRSRSQAMPIYVSTGITLSNDVYFVFPFFLLLSSHILLLLHRTTLRDARVNIVSLRVPNHLFGLHKFAHWSLSRRYVITYFSFSKRQEVNNTSAKEVVSKNIQSPPQ